MTDPLGAVTTYGYDAAGRQTSRTDHLGGVETWGYDAAGRLTSETDQLNRTTTYTYNAASKIATATDPTGRVASYSYDAAGRLNQILDTLGATTETTTYGYDTAGRRTSASNPLGAWAYHYDAADRLTSVTAPGNRVTSWTWDNAGRRTGMTYPNGTALTYNYHATNGRLTSITNGATTVAAYTYNNDGQPLSVNAVGTTRTWAYNAGGQLTNYVQPGVGAGLNTTLTYDSAGRIATDTTNTTVHTYSYDLADQLLSNNRTVQPGLPAETRSYTYDALGRRSTRTINGVAEAYTYNAASELLAAGNATLAHDAAGRLISQSSPSPGLQNPNATYTYNAGGKLASTQITAGGTGPHTTTRGYDPAGNLTQVNTSTIDWDLAGDLPQPLLGVDLYGPAGLAARVQAGNWQATLHDVHGSIINQTSPSTIGAQQGAAYDEYGINADTPSTLARGYHGELEIDGITHLRARDYQATTGRFTTTDPLDGVNGTTTIANPYHYTDNNPINLTDPTGLRTGDRPSATDERFAPEVLARCFGSCPVPPPTTSGLAPAPKPPVVQPDVRPWIVLGAIALTVVIASLDSEDEDLRKARLRCRNLYVIGPHWFVALGSVPGQCQAHHIAQDAAVGTQIFGNPTPGSREFAIWNRNENQGYSYRYEDVPTILLGTTQHQLATNQQQSTTLCSPNYGNERAVAIEALSRAGVPLQLIGAAIFAIDNYFKDHLGWTDTYPITRIPKNRRNCPTYVPPGRR